MPTALAHRGIETHLVDENAWLLSQIADPEITEPVQESLRELGANLHFGVTYGRSGQGGRPIRRRDQLEGVIDADICVISTHGEPETTIARSMGLDGLAPPARWWRTSGGTSMARVYAAGDVVEVPQNLTGIAVQGLTRLARDAAGPRGGGERRRRRQSPLRPGQHPVGHGRWAGPEIGGGEPRGAPGPCSASYVVGAANGISRARCFPWSAAGW